MDINIYYNWLGPFLILKNQFYQSHATTTTTIMKQPLTGVSLSFDCSAEQQTVFILYTEHGGSDESNQKSINYYLLPYNWLVSEHLSKQMCQSLSSALAYR